MNSKSCIDSVFIRLPKLPGKTQWFAEDVMTVLENYGIIKEVLINKYSRKEQLENSLDDFYTEIQVPILLSAIYFAFQLPSFRSLLFKHLPFLFGNDGNLNFNGYVMTSIMFGSLYYSLNKYILSNI